MAISLKTEVKKIENLVESESAGEAVMLDLDRGAYFGLNDVGTRIYQLCDEMSSLQAIRDVLVEEFDVPSEQCESELIEFVQRMIEHKLLQIIN